MLEKIRETHSPFLERERCDSKCQASVSEISAVTPRPLLHVTLVMAASAAWRQNFHLFKPCLFDFTFLPLIDLPPLTPDEQQEEEKQNSVTLLPDLLNPACKYTTHELCVKLDGRANPGLHLGDLNAASSRSTLLVSLVRVNSCPSQSCSYILRLGNSNTLAGPQTPDSCLLNSCVLIYCGVRNSKQRSAIFS